jgi:hypothetical protein
MARLCGHDNAFSPPRRARSIRGLARRKAQTYGIHDPFGIAAGASRRATCADAAAASACYLRPICRRRAALSPSALRFPCKQRWEPAFGIGQTVVSQLLAGPLSGPGRSPGAARVPDPRDQARGRRATSRLYARLAKRPFGGRGECDDSRGLNDGDSAAIATSRHTGDSRYPAPRGTRGKEDSLGHADARPLDSGFRRNDGCVDSVAESDLHRETHRPTTRSTAQKTSFTVPCKSASAAVAAPDDPSCIERGWARGFLSARISEREFDSSRRRSNIIRCATASGRLSPLA